MLTRLLHRCGLYLGPKDALMPAQADNPDGFWEHLGFVALNDELLGALGGAWDLPPKTDENLSDERLDTLRMKARLLIEGFHSAQIWGWKDPRNSLTLPFWEDLLPGLKTLIIVRNPKGDIDHVTISATKKDLKQAVPFQTLRQQQHAQR